MFCDSDTGDVWLTVDEAARWLYTDTATVLDLAERRVLRSCSRHAGGELLVAQDVVSIHGPRPVAVGDTLPPPADP